MNQESKSINKNIMTNILANELNMLFFYFVNVHMYTYLAFVMLVAIIVHPLHH